jgi:hypothetical protein
MRSARAAIGRVWKASLSRQGRLRTASHACLAARMSRRPAARRALTDSSWAWIGTSRLTAGVSRPLLVTCPDFGVLHSRRRMHIGYDMPGTTAGAPRSRTPRWARRCRRWSPWRCRRRCWMSRPAGRRPPRSCRRAPARRVTRVRVQARPAAHRMRAPRRSIARARPRSAQCARASRGAGAGGGLAGARGQV